MRLLVGCPVYDRAWIMDHWFDHLQSWPVEEFVFVSPPDDVATRRIIHSRLLNASVYPGPEKGHRNWANAQRIQDMCRLRNRLLLHARNIMIAVPRYDAFFSLDSDVLVPALSSRPSFLDNLQQNDAVSPLVYLGNGTTTNVFVGNDHQLRRAATNPGQGRAKVLCAAVLMSRRLVLDPQVNYEYHRQGEDFGWSKSARDRGYRLGYDFRMKCKHVMSPDQLGVMDRRIGW